MSFFCDLRIPFEKKRKKERKKRTKEEKEKKKKRPRLFDQLQHFGTLRGADAITDHGAENVVIAQRIPTTIFLWPVASFVSSIPSFHCFHGSHSSAAREKKSNG